MRNCAGTGWRFEGREGESDADKGITCMYDGSQRLWLMFSSVAMESNVWARFMSGMVSEPPSNVSGKLKVGDVGVCRVFVRS